MVYSGKFYGYSYKILGNREEARDAVQDLYLKLWSIRNSFSNINSIEAFATTIIRNLCIDRLKKIKSVTLQSDTYKEHRLCSENASDDNYEDNIQARVNLVRDAMKKLPEIQQKVFVMRDFEEKEFEEISLELNLSLENSRVILSRARKRIRELIECAK